MRSLIIILALFAMTSFSEAATLNIVAVGDSLTAATGWPERLQAQLGAAYSGLTVNVTKQALGGITTVEMLATYIPAAIAANPNVIIIMAGTNEPYYSYPAADFQSRMESIIALVQAANNGSSQYNGKIFLVLVTNPPAAQCGGSWAYCREGSSPDPSNGNKIYGTQIADQTVIMENLASQYGLPVVDMYNGIKSFAGWDTFGGSAALLSDGVHFVTKGYYLISTIIQSRLVNYLKPDGTVMDVSPAYTGLNIVRPASDRLYPQGFLLAAHRRSLLGVGR